EITVSNPHPTRDITVDVVDNGVLFGQVTVPAGSDSIPVNYSVDGDAAGGVNIASASYSLPTGGDSVDSAPVPYSFGSAVVTLVGNSADVLDNQLIDGIVSGSPIDEQVTAGADGTYSGIWGYPTTVGPFACGTTHTVDNTASVNATDSDSSDSAMVNAVINVAACDGGDGGYTLTPGYWKTHSMAHNDGRHYDDTWDAIGDAGENEDYFDPAYTWIEIMWVNDGGNAYVKLSRAYIAATLNGLNGADTTAVDAELAWAADWLANNTVDGVGSLKGKAKKAAQEAVEVAGTLDDYNNGIIGPGHGNF
ncbi:MAG: hypothetical protein HOF01_00005, partial [Chloroflexi bacterium]|nr:hypothetical protein [Chloroflexota bacterium]